MRHELARLQHYSNILFSQSEIVICTSAQGDITLISDRTCQKLGIVGVPTHIRDLFCISSVTTVLDSFSWILRNSQEVLLFQKLYGFDTEFSGIKLLNESMKVSFFRCAKVIRSVPSSLLSAVSNQVDEFVLTFHLNYVWP